MFLSGLVFLLLLSPLTYAEERKTFIVHMSNMPSNSNFKHKIYWFEACVRSISSSAEIIYSYDHAINGFSARFTSEEVELLVVRPEVLSVVLELQYKLETTRSPVFLGLDHFVAAEPFPLNVSSIGDVVVGVIDTRVWPESRSFIDKGFGPPPRSWKGKCEDGKNFTALLCNRKLVGARFFVKGYEALLGRPIDETKEFRSPRDNDGHGTHTSSTAVGSAVKGAHFLGYASGIARGMAPQARVAVYKACWSSVCVGSDVLAAIDQAIEDNVNVLSMSLGLGTLEYHQDHVAIGAFAATERGIIVSASAGNYGPSESTVLNVAPWIVTVGAGTVDRDFPAVITLGNGKSFSGVSSLFKSSRGLPNKQFPLVYDKFGGNRTGKLVLVDELDGTNLINKMERSNDGLGLIYASNGFGGRDHLADYTLLPSMYVDKPSGDKIREYVLTDSNPTAKIIFKGTFVNVKPSPVVALFSSRGPNPITPEILKPDLIAPGVNILAAWTGVIDPDYDLGHIEFKIASGTSMSCPHLSGIVALLRAAHPEWSPAAIRSALMTTATIISNDGKPIIDATTGKPSTPFAHGAGHVSPVSALNPGLIYDLTAEDYLHFLCASNYKSWQIKIVARRDFVCDPIRKYRVGDLNYPSFALTMNQSRGGGGAYTYTRVVKSVGGAGRYTVKVLSDITVVNIIVEPAVLDFKKFNEKKSYTVTFTVSSSMNSGTNSFGSIEWSDGRHIVRSSIALTWS